MSLKNFHLLFIAASITLTAGFALWCLLSEDGAAQAGANVMAVISLIVAFGLVAYLIKIPRKLQGDGIE